MADETETTRIVRVQKAIADALEPIMAANDIRAAAVFALLGHDGETVTPFDVVSVPDASVVDYEAMLMDFVHDVVDGAVAPETETTTTVPFRGRSH